VSFNTRNNYEHLFAAAAIPSPPPSPLCCLLQLNGMKWLLSVHALPMTDWAT